MPLEDLTGAKYIDSLNPDWPLGSDTPDAGDDHLRGIKNTLVRSFPSINGALTRSLASLNRGSVPIGARMLFYSATAPQGWVRVTGITATHGLRVVTSEATTGGSAAGSDDPVMNAKVASHTHGVSGVSLGLDSVDHNHGVVADYTLGGGAHDHQVAMAQVSVAAGGSYSVYAPGASSIPTDVQPAHAHVVPYHVTGGASLWHTHAVSGAVDANSGAATWTPRYMDVILCERVETP